MAVGLNAVRRGAGALALAGAAIAGGAAAVVPLASATASTAQASTATATVVTVTKSAKWGTILVTGTGYAIYRLTADSKNKSVCTGACATAWPPVLLASGQKTPIGKGVSGLGSISRSGGQRQVTYEGIPLYTFIGDRKPGQVNGNVKDHFGQWWSINPAHPLAVPSASVSTTAAGGTGIAY